MQDTQIHCSKEQKAAAEAEQSLVLPARPSTCWDSKGHRRVWFVGFILHQEQKQATGICKSHGKKTDIQCFFLL